MSALWTGLEVSKKKKGFRDISSVVSVQETGWWPNDMAGWHWEKVSQSTRPQRWAEAKGNVVLRWQWMVDLFEWYFLNLKDGNTTNIPIDVEKYQFSTLFLIYYKANNNNLYSN